MLGMIETCGAGGGKYTSCVFAMNDDVQPQPSLVTMQKPGCTSSTKQTGGSRPSGRPRCNLTPASGECEHRISPQKLNKEQMAGQGAVMEIWWEVGTAAITHTHTHTFMTVKKESDYSLRHASLCATSPCLWVSW